MKKVFAILAVAGLMTACNNAEKTEAATDSATVTVDTAATTVDTTAVMDTTVKAVDTAAKAK
jgi:ABC-type molybdate transport system substrate-binding protein